jgi:hypothetical protein
MDKKSLAVAYGASKRRKAPRGYAMGGRVDSADLKAPGLFHPKAVAEALRKKQMPEETEEDDFLSDEMDTEVPELGYPDPDEKESTEGMGEEEDDKSKRDRVMGSIMRGIQIKKR